MSTSSQPSVDLRSLLLGAIVVAAIVNLLQLGAIDANAERRYKIFDGYSDNDVLALGRRVSGTVKHRYAAALSMNDVAPGSTLILPERGSFPSQEFRIQMLTFGKVTAFRRLDYDPNTFAPKLDAKRNVIARTPKGGRPKYLKRRFVVLARTEFAGAKSKKKRTKAREFIVLRRGKLDLLVDTSLVAKELKALKL